MIKQEAIYSFGTKQLIFGLRWQPMVSQASTQQAKLMAKQHKAKMWVMAGHTFINVGLSSKRCSHKKPIYAAAVCYALLYPQGWHATVYQLNNNTYWLAVAHEGTPMSLGDVLFETEQEAQDALVSLGRQYSELSHTEQVVALTDFLALIVTHSLQTAVVHKRRSKSLSVVFIFIFVLGALSWWLFEPAPVVQATDLPKVDPYLTYWQQKKIQPNGKDALKQLILGLEHMPLLLGNWRLQAINCEVIKAKEHWLCNMKYSAITDTATTAQMESVLPESWRIEEVGLQTVVLQNRIDFESGSSRWRSAEQIRKELLNKLQHVRPAFSALRLAEPSALSQGIAQSHDYSPVFVQGLHFDGPLRSLVLLVDLGDAVHWQRISLLYQPQRNASLKSSALQVSLQGVIYVRD